MGEVKCMYVGRERAQWPTSCSSFSSSVSASSSSATIYSASLNAVKTSAQTASWVCGDQRCLHHASNTGKVASWGASSRRFAGNSSKIRCRTSSSVSGCRRNSGWGSAASQPAAALPASKAAALPASTSFAATTWLAKTISSSIKEWDTELAPSLWTPWMRPSSSVWNQKWLLSNTTAPLSMRNFRRAPVMAARALMSESTSGAILAGICRLESSHAWSAKSTSL
mmetsp:Transcript_89520/g.227683  ORF Transcript_89520/g.227683 Transcript_89520/m.227683 type:complete len:225 (+) Transcript_89520:970-1644(+)